MNFSLTTILLLAAAGGCRGYDYDYDVFVQTQEVPWDWEETPSPSPVDVDTDSLEPTPSPSSSSTALSTFVQSIVPTGGACDMGGGRKLRGARQKIRRITDVFRELVDERELDSYSDRGALFPPCLIQGPFVGATCLVITDISYFMTIFYMTLGGKYVIGDSDVTQLLKNYLLGEASDMATEHIKGWLEDLLERISDVGIDFLEDLSTTLDKAFPDEDVAELHVIRQLGIELHAQISGDVYTWTCSWWCGCYWKPTGTYKSPKFQLMPPVMFQYYGLGLSIGDPNFIPELIRGFQELFRLAMTAIQNNAAAIKAKILLLATGSHDVVVWNGRLLKP